MNFCLLSVVDSEDWDSEDYLQRLVELNRESQLDRTDFRLNGSSFQQIFLIKDESINIKLLTELPDGIVVIWDYLIARNSYNNISQEIESSIGSIKIQEKEET